MGVEFDINDDFISAKAETTYFCCCIYRHSPRFHDRLAVAHAWCCSPRPKACRCFTKQCLKTDLATPRALKPWALKSKCSTSCLGGPACRFFERNAKHSAVVHGVTKLHGAEVTMPDIRAGFSLSHRSCRSPRANDSCTTCTTSSVATTSRTKTSAS